MPEVEVGNDPWLSNRGPNLIKTFSKRTLAIAEFQWDNYRQKRRIPPYKPTNPDWNIAFRALGLDYATIKRFWNIFCKANKSRDGQICMDEFLEYFRLDRTGYVEKTFHYFDATGGGEVDFLEFVVSTWNVCYPDPQTLTNFTFDMYDVDSDGLLRYPEIEAMVKELFGQDGVQHNSQGIDCMADLMKLVEENGAITLDLFTTFTIRHSILLFPIYQIQRQLQSKVFGLAFWIDLHKRIEILSIKTRGRPNSWIKENVSSFDRNMITVKPRHILVLLRSYRRERGGLDVEEEDLLQCKNLKEWVAKNAQYWHDDQWDKEIPSRFQALLKKFDIFVFSPLSRSLRKMICKKVPKVAKSLDEKEPICLSNDSTDPNIPAEQSCEVVVRNKKNIQRRVRPLYSLSTSRKQKNSSDRNHAGRTTNSGSFIGKHSVGRQQTKGPPAVDGDNYSRMITNKERGIPTNQREHASFVKKSINRGKIYAIYSPERLRLLQNDTNNAPSFKSMVTGS